MADSGKVLYEQYTQVEMCIGMGIPNGNGNPMRMAIKLGIGKSPQCEWELPALPWQFTPIGFMLR